MLRLHAVLMPGSPGAAGQARSWTVERPAPTPDAHGAVRALARAVDDAAAQIADWVRTAAPCR